MTEPKLDADAVLKSSRSSLPPPSLPKPNLGTVAPKSLPSVVIPTSGLHENSAARVCLHPLERSVEERSKMASFNARVVAVVIDLVITIGVSAVLMGLLPNFVAFLGPLLGLAYFVTRDSLFFLGGRSFGKKVMHLRVLSLVGDSLVGDWRSALIRNGVLLVLPMIFFETYLLLIRENTAMGGVRLGDEWAKTRVFVEIDPLETEVKA